MAMVNSKYWADRFKELESVQYTDAMKAYREVEPYFDKMQHDIDGMINAWLNRIAKNNGISLTEARKLLTKDELEEFHWTVEQYIKAGKENAIDQRWMKQLENASAKAHISRLEALKIQIQQAMETAFGNETDAVDEAIRHAYEEGYYRTAYIVQKGTGIGESMAQINTDELDTLIRKPWAADGSNFSDRIWSRKLETVNAVQNAVMRTCAMGEAPDKAAKSLEKLVSSTVSNSKYAASRIIRTESAFYASVAKQQCFKDLDVDEFEYVATLDMRTSEGCAEMDGKHFPMVQFQPGVTAPPLHPNCRCTTCPYFNDEFTEGEMRSSRDLETGKSVQRVPSDMTYKQWKEKFVDKPKKSEYNELKERIHKLIATEYLMAINQGQQDKHIRGTNNFDESRSELTADPEELMNLYAGKGDPKISRNGKWAETEWFEHDSIIGIWRDRTGNALPTTNGIIHYSKTKGLHIVPAHSGGTK